MEYISPTEREYFKPQPLLSDAYIAAETIVKLLKEVTENLWCYAANKRTSFVIGDRWETIELHCRILRQPAEKYCIDFLSDLEKYLEYWLNELDEINMNYDPAKEYNKNLFSYELQEYAEIIINALVEEMSKEEQILFINERKYL